MRVGRENDRGRIARPQLIGDVCLGLGPDLVLRLAALLHDIGKPKTRTRLPGGKVAFHHHEVKGAHMARARLTALQGAEVLVYPTAIGWHPKEKAEFGLSQYDAWRTVQAAPSAVTTPARGSRTSS